MDVGTVAIRPSRYGWQRTSWTADGRAKMKGAATRLMRKLLSAFLAVLLLAFPVGAAPVFDAANNAEDGGTNNSIQVTVTVGGGCSNNILIAIPFTWTQTTATVSS